MVRIWHGTIKQPFGVGLFHGIWRSHPRFMNRTVMVAENDVNGAFQMLNR